MKVKLNKRKTKVGISLFLEIYWGYTKDKDGKIKHQREYEKLDLYLIENPTNQNDKRHNKQALVLANNIRSKREIEIQSGKYEFKNPNQRKIKLLDYFHKLMEERKQSKGNYGSWDSVHKHLQKFCREGMLLGDVNIEFVEGFKKFLLTEKLTKGGKKLSTNSASSYFNKFRTCINTAYEKELIGKNPVQKVKSIKGQETKREYLTEEEIQLLAITDCRYPVLKRAFLFSCFTGLRWSDCNKLVWSEVNDEKDSSKIIFRQQKTKGQEYLEASKQARELLGQRKEPNDRVFIGLRYSDYMNTALSRWVLKAGITKHVTFHVARHTHATLLLTKGVDLFVIMDILGHKDIRTTQIYTKIVNEKRKEAIDKLPEFELNISFDE
ncbi:tyrosine-type recombinase/integrase [Aquimarina agarivorans]|uniref:tyrosine-type recombinase/integrase n=1 Tax=Aquimarina agarivorans TaxID=980584 RepID=UPI000248F87F|nr:site-specific integrase [Aquimarina agarivorans]